MSFLRKITHPNKTYRVVNIIVIGYEGPDSPEVTNLTEDEYEFVKSFEKEELPFPRATDTDATALGWLRSTGFTGQPQFPGYSGTPFPLTRLTSGIGTTSTPRNYGIYTTGGMASTNANSIRWEVVNPQYPYVDVNGPDIERAITQDILQPAATATISEDAIRQTIEDILENGTDGAANPTLFMSEAASRQFDEAIREELERMSSVARTSRRRNRNETR
jgi:hypothetical protein